MTDRELLEMAAKAAGIKIEAWTVYGPYTGGLEGCIWDPLKDDGDALRLAVKLNLTVSIDQLEVEAWKATECGGEALEKATMGYSIEEATRRAIVRAAAAIGEQM